MFFRIV